MSNAVNNLAPHYVAQYAIKITHSFNRFYNNYKIFDIKNKEKNYSKEENYDEEDEIQKITKKLIYCLKIYNAL